MCEGSIPRTTEKILHEQQRQADEERQRPKPPTPQGLTPLQLLQCGLWGWCDMRSRAKQKFHGPKLDYSPGEIAAIAEAISPETAAPIGDSMKKHDVFPSPYLKCADLEGQARVLTIKSAPYELLKNRGKEERKTALHFEEIQKVFPLNVTNWSSVCSVTGEDDTDRWPGKQIEVYPDKTPLDGEMVDCIRVRAPTRKKPAPPQPQPRPAPALAVPSEEMDDDILFEWEQADRSGVEP
jgi:hypothetical protein